jgi:RHS repeat-associated protein
VATLQVTAPAGSVLDQSFEYAYTAGGAGPVDPGPNLDRVIDHRDANESRFYFYDALDRLWKSTTLAGAALYTYSYDANGNRTQETAPAGTTTTTYATGTDRIAQSSGANAKHYAHDAYGSRIWAGPTPHAGLPSHVYNELNRLVEVRDPTTQAVLGQYTYDAFGRRVRKVTSAGTQLFFYDAAGQLLEERSLATAPNAVRDYVWLEEEPVGTVDSGPQPTKFAWVHTDRLGTPLAVTSSPATGNAATIWRASYAPFGLATVNEDPDEDLQAYAMNLRFPGQRWDAESRGHYNYFRDYDPATGVFASSDPIGILNGQDANLFRYVGNDPVNWFDPLGLLRLPANPTGLPAGWSHDPSHKDPNGSRWRGPNGDVLDFHEGRPSEPGWRGKDHWHHNEGDEHLEPGDEIPDPECEPEDESSSPFAELCEQHPEICAISAGYLIYRGVRMLQSLAPPLWPTIPANAVAP